jgi:hypothetical protein
MAGWIAAATIGGSLIGAYGASEAADTQAQAARDAQDQQLAMFNTQNKQNAPFRGAGYNALNTIGSFLPGQYQQYDEQGNPTTTGSGTGYLTREFTNQDLNANLAPNYAFQLEQGLGGVRNLANSSGGLIGGNAFKGMQDYTQNFAGNAFQNAFGNFQGQRTNIYNTLAGISGLGQTANQTTANLSGNTANAMSSLGVGAANAQAAGTVGMTNAISGGLNTLGNYGYMNRLLNQGGTVNSYNQLPAYSGGYSGGSTSMQDIMNSRVA